MESAVAFQEHPARTAEVMSVQASNAGGPCLYDLHWRLRVVQVPLQ